MDCDGFDGKSLEKSPESRKTEEYQQKALESGLERDARNNVPEMYVK